MVGGPRAPMGHMGQSQAEGEGDLQFSHLRNGLLCCLLVLGVKGLWLMCRGPRVE